MFTSADIKQAPLYDKVSQTIALSDYLSTPGLYLSSDKGKVTL